MAEAIFTYEGINYSIQCDINIVMKELIDRFFNKIGKEDAKDDFIFLYNGNQISYELTFIEQANLIDRETKKMNILVNSNKETVIKEIISKEIICPECHENIIIDIKDFKINLYGCKNGHTFNNILLNKYEECQKLDVSKIICNNCNNNIYNKEFYICNTCNKNLCLLCKSIHDQNHSIINYDDKNYICKKHNDPFIKYCKTCKKDICIICEDEHSNHDIINFTKILSNKNELLILMENMKNIIDKFKYKVNVMKEILDKMISMMDIYYKINNNIIQYYNMNKRNYNLLQSISIIKNNNEKLIKELDKLINEDKIYEY